MANNRWQAGLYGNYTDERDEQVRLIVETIQAQDGCSPSEAIKRAILDRAIAQGPEIEPIRDLCAYAQGVDLTGVHMRLDSLSEQVAQLAEAIGGSQIAPPECIQYAQPTDEEARLREVAEAEANIPAAVHLAMTYSKTKPGMRLEEQ